MFFFFRIGIVQFFPLLKILLSLSKHKQNESLKSCLLQHTAIPAVHFNYGCMTSLFIIDTVLLHRAQTLYSPDMYNPVETCFKSIKGMFLCKHVTEVNKTGYIKNHIWTSKDTLYGRVLLQLTGLSIILFCSKESQSQKEPGLIVQGQNNFSSLIRA